MRIVYIGCVKSSAIFLKKIFTLSSAQVTGVVTTRNSCINSDYVDLTPYCNDVDIFYTENINDKNTVQFIRDKKPDVIYCFGWSRLIGKELLYMAPYGVIGYHPAEIPNNRGRHPIIWALALGLRSTASTFFKMDEGADTGDIISQEKVIISDEDDAGSLYDKLLVVGCRQIELFTYNMALGRLEYIKQEADKGNTWRKRGRSDGIIDWRMSCKGIYNLVRALTHPYVGASFVYAGREYRVWKVKYSITDEYYNIEYGKVLEVYSDNHFFVKAGDGIVEVMDCDLVQLKKGMYL